MSSYVSGDDDGECEEAETGYGATRLLEDLKPSKKKALHELRTKLEEAIINNELLSPPRHHERRKGAVAHDCSAGSCIVSLNVEEEEEEKEKDHLNNLSVWGIPLLPSKGHEGTNIILLKFLVACEFKAPAALQMLQKMLRWRRELAVDGILEEDFESPHLNGTAYMAGRDKEGQPLCYNTYGLFRDKDLYKKTFGDEERCERFLRWRVQLMEEGIVKQLSLKPGGVGQMVQIIDLKGSMRPSMKELHTTMKKVFFILQENYPEFIAKSIFINVSFRFYAYQALFSHFMPPRTRSKFIFAKPSRVTETLLKYIDIEDLPVKYGGLKREDDDEFPPVDNAKVLELTLAGGATAFIEIPIIEPGVTVVWDLTVVGWEANYKEEFIPEDEGSYKILIRKENNIQESMRSSFYINEPGKVILTITNRSFKKKKKVFYRSKSKPTIPLYNLLNQAKHPIL